MVLFNYVQKNSHFLKYLVPSTKTKEKLKNKCNKLNETNFLEVLEISWYTCTS